MTIDPGDSQQEMWGVLAMRQTKLSPKPLRHTSWHPSKHAAEAYAESVVQRGDKVISIRGWREIEHVDWAKDSNKLSGVNTKPQQSNEDNV